MEKGTELNNHEWIRQFAAQETHFYGPVNQG